MSEPAKGVLAMLIACTIWGMSGLYYKLLDHVTPIEILCHRTLWGFVLFVGLLFFQGRLRALPAALATRRNFTLIILSALVISFNWFVFISAIHLGHATEASLGYYIFPLVTVLMGALFYRERLGWAQIISVGLASIGVLVLSLSLQVAPWVSLILAVSFAIYGALKKGLATGPVVSVTVEVALLSPFALAALLVINQRGIMQFGADPLTTLMLIFAGIITAVPLILFSYAARRVSLATVGLTQYVNPTLQFLVATLIFHELFTLWHAVAFALIWVALALYTVASLRQGRAERRASRQAAATGAAL